MDDFYAARDSIMPPLQWTNIAPPFTGRKNYLFLGSEAGGTSAAIAYSLIETAKLNGVNPQDWLTYALANMQDTKISDLDKLMPWNYTSGQ